MPNPAKDQLSITFAKPSTNGVVTITDISGRVVKIVNVEKHTKTLSIDLSTQSKGIYIINMINAEGTISKKVLLE